MHLMSYFCYCRKIVGDLQLQGKAVAVTGPTGISCMQLDGAVTIHHWARISDGRYSLRHLSFNFLHDDIIQDAKARIQAVIFLVIDEIWMASQRIFKMVELVCRLSR